MSYYAISQFISIFTIVFLRKFAILLTDCMTTSALNEQFIANLVLLRCHPSENASVIEYANSVEAQLQNEKLEIRESYELFSVKNYSV